MKGDSEEKPRKRGRPSTYSKEIADHICERIADGVTLRQICRDLGIKWRTVYEWLETHPDFLAAYARARDIGADAIAEEALEIADPLSIGEEYEDDGLRVKVRRSDMLGHRKLQVETRLKLLAKWNPKKYGDRVDLHHGGQAENPRAVLLQQGQGTALKPSGDE